MKEMPTSRNATSTVRWVWHVLGVLVCTATLVSIVKNGFSIDLSGLPARIYQQYAWLRDTLYGPLVWTVAYFGLAFPPLLKDLLTGYCVVAASHFRALLPVSNPDDHPRWIIAISAALWPVFHLLAWHVIRDAKQVSKEAQHPLYGIGFKPNAYEREATSKVEEWRRFKRFLALNMVLIIACAISFFLWNHFTNLYGPI
jgi:hypothetical protein